ncbi:MAG: peptidylprolyl isomerase [Halobacteriaceae archaeon]
MPISEGDSVTLEYTGRLDDGTVFDTTYEEVAKEAGLAQAQPNREYTPLTVELGNGTVIEGLEEALIGLEEGTTHTLTIPPEKAYGERRDDQIIEYDVEEFSEMLGSQPPTEGTYIETEDGDHAEITHVDDEIVRLDFNHQLAGETLEFEIEIVDVN